jgi:hypothetical protein
MTQDNAEGVLFSFRKQINELQKSELSNVYGNDIFPAVLGRVYSLMAGDTIAEDENISARLNNIHTETTQGERKFLFNFFKYLWKGDEHVLEIGPFLGGTTRAIAMGMMQNIQRREHTKIFTYDKFKDYYESNQLINALKPAFDSGLFSQEIKVKMQKSTNFLEIFRLFHQSQDYYKIINESEGFLPYEREDIKEINNIFTLEKNHSFSAVFVDGAKSWFGLKYFMETVLPHTMPGSYYIFQDYGARTCFWIPVFIERFKDAFKLISYVDDTYTFRLSRNILPAEIEEKYPDKAEHFSSAEYERIFRNLTAEAVNVKDIHSYLILHLQLGAAYAYIGEHEKSRNLLIDLLKTPFERKYRNLILTAMEIPTYNKSGNISIK